jgi:hypothetical protein
MQGSKTSSERNACHERGDELVVGASVDLWPLDQQQHHIFFMFWHANPIEGGHEFCTGKSSSCSLAKCFNQIMQLC